MKAGSVGSLIATVVAGKKWSIESAIHKSSRMIPFWFYASSLVYFITTSVTDRKGGPKARSSQRPRSGRNTRSRYRHGVHGVSSRGRDRQADGLWVDICQPPYLRGGEHEALKASSERTEATKRLSFGTKDKDLPMIGAPQKNTPTLRLRCLSFENNFNISS